MAVAPTTIAAAQAYLRPDLVGAIPPRSYPTEPPGERRGREFDEILMRRGNLLTPR